MVRRVIEGVPWIAHSPSHYELLDFPDIQIIYNGKVWTDKRPGGREFYSMAEVSQIVLAVNEYAACRTVGH